ncbi:hypothetical protein PYCCODRAFT_859699 [Trametes coccinea BRFM310]|uniref:Uncharacterized protein n=1 Tax=Trametes coccinea (strain BRFM310) TaxID=1353009 RepID=A0A1Y2IFK5_TRAC3|nr:hypothetical protein PYCCODRAFT_859699 [Trametes coccinea BRFM310]
MSVLLSTQGQCGWLLLVAYEISCEIFALDALCHVRLFRHWTSTRIRRHSHWTNSAPFNPTSQPVVHAMTSYVNHSRRDATALSRNLLKMHCHLLAAELTGPVFAQCRCSGVCSSVEAFGVLDLVMRQTTFGRCQRVSSVETDGRRLVQGAASVMGAFMLGPPSPMPCACPTHRTTSSSTGPLCHYCSIDSGLCRTVLRCHRKDGAHSIQQDPLCDATGCVRQRRALCPGKAVNNIF